MILVTRCAKSFWGHGYATEAALAVLDFVREQGVLYVTATHDVNNPASGRVMQRLGNALLLFL